MRIIILGARLDGQAGVVLSALRQSGEHEVVGFLDNNPELQGAVLDGVPVIGSTDELLSLELVSDIGGAFIAIGENFARGRLARRVEGRGLQLINVIHPSAVILPGVSLGNGVFIGPGAVIGKGVVIGGAVIVSSGAVIDHDCVISDNAHIGPGCRLAGRVKVGKNALLGIGTSIIPDIVIGEDAIIGAGSVVVRDAPPDRISVGVPARLKEDLPTDAQIRGAAAPFFAEQVPLISPTLPQLEEIENDIQTVLRSGYLSNFAKYERQLQERVRNYLGVQYCFPVSNATIGLLVAIHALGLKGKVVVPSFTFFSTVHALVWNGLEPVFVDIDRETLNVDPERVEDAITPDTCAIVGVHVFGNPCDVSALQQIAEARGLHLLFDAAHALGSTYKRTPIGNFGDVEVFSMSGTKVVTAGEGGLVATNNPDVAKFIEQARNYGNRGDYDCEVIGLNAKMPELSALLGLATFKHVDEYGRRRNEIASLYRELLAVLPGLSFQRISDGSFSNYNYFAIVVDPSEFGLDRDELASVLAKNNVMTRKYFVPPVHRLTVYRQYLDECAPRLRITDHVSQNILCLPIWSHMRDETVRGICAVIRRAHALLGNPN